MQFLKKEWRTLVVVVWLVALTFLGVSINLQLGRIQATEARIASTLGTVESIVIGTDANVMQVYTKTGTIESNVDFIVERIRRR